MNRNFEFLCSNITGKRSKVFLSFMSNSLKKLKMNVVHIYIYISYLFSPLANILCWICVSCPLCLGPEQQTVPFTAAVQFLAQTPGTWNREQMCHGHDMAVLHIHPVRSSTHISKSLEGIESQVNCEDRKREDPFKISHFYHCTILADTCLLFFSPDMVIWPP
jgi:hypothetical protein